MSDSRLDELLSTELDKQLSDAEQQELQQLLKSSDDAVLARREYKKLDQLLRDMPEQMLPANLHQRIAQSIRLPKSAASTKPGWLSDLFQSPVTRFSFAAAAGILLSLAIFNAGGPQLTDAPTKEMLGSMIPQQGQGSGNVIDQLQLTGGGFMSGAALLQLDQRLVLSINVESAEPIEIAVDFSDSGVRYESLADSGNEFEIVSFDSSVLRLRSTGKQEVQVFLSRERIAPTAESAGIKLDFSSTGQESARGALRLAH